MRAVQVAEMYYVARRLRAWLEARITEGLDHRTPLYLWIVMRDVVESPGSSLQDISRRLGMVQSMVSKAATHAEARGWIRRAVDPRDRRRSHLYPTEALLQRLAPGLAATVDDVLDELFGPTLGPDDRATLRRSLQLLYDRFKALEEK